MWNLCREDPRQFLIIAIDVTAARQQPSERHLKTAVEIIDMSFNRWSISTNWEKVLL